MTNETPTAFPWKHGDMTCTGMTLRDYFAAKALQGLLAQETAEFGLDIPSDVAAYAYGLADHMLKAREV